MGRKINEARDRLDIACQNARYRPEDVARLRAKLHQLETMLPLQSSFVKVPYENSLGGFALFTQGASALVPELNGFEGVDYYDVANGSNVLLYGKNFSIYETALVAGGVDVPQVDTHLEVVDPSTNTQVTLKASLTPSRDTDGNLLLLSTDGKAISTLKLKDPGAYEILSRQVIRVRIPPKATKVRRADGSEVVEVYIAAPNGISNKLLIPIRPPTPPATPKAATPLAFSSRNSAILMSLADSDLTIKVKYTPGTTPKTEIQSFPESSSLRIVPNGILMQNGKANVRFVFPLSVSNKVVTEISISGVEFDPFTNGYKLNAKHLNQLGINLLEQFRVGGITLNPETVVSTKRIEVQPLTRDSEGMLPPLIVTTNQLTVNFEFIVKGASLTPPAQPQPAVAPNAFRQAPPADSRVAELDPLTRRASAQEPVSTDLLGLPPLPAETPRDLLVVPTQAVTPPLPITPRALEAAIAPGLTFPIPGGTVQVPGAGNGNVSFSGLGGTVQMPGTVRVQLPGTTSMVEVPGTVALPLPGSQPTGVIPSQTTVIAPRQPSINISVPVTNNNARQPRQGGLLHRNRAPISPQNPTRPPLLERLRNGP